MVQSCLFGYSVIQQRILSHSKPRILLKWISCKENRQKPARKPKKRLKTNLITSHTITQDTKFLFFSSFLKFSFFKNRGVCTTRFRACGHPLPRHQKNVTRPKHKASLTDRNERYTKPKTKVFDI